MTRDEVALGFLGYEDDDVAAPDRPDRQQHALGGVGRPER
jgi:hypothetical protein